MPFDRLFCCVLFPYGSGHIISCQAHFWMIKTDIRRRLVPVNMPLCDRTGPVLACLHGVVWRIVIMVRLIRLSTNYPTPGRFYGDFYLCETESFDGRLRNFSREEYIVRKYSTGYSKCP